MPRAHRGLVSGLAVLVLFVGTARAQDVGDAFRTGGLLLAQLDYPAKVSLGFGLIATRMPANFECKTSCLFRGLTIQGSAGPGAGEIAIGYGSVVGETGGGSWLLRRIFVGFGVLGALVKTWGANTIDPDDAAYLGVEGAMTIAQFGLRLGVFHRIEPIAGQRDWRVFGGAGWGF